MGKAGFPAPLSGGCALPPRGGMGKPGFPMPPARGPGPLKPSHRVGAWGKPVSPHPSPGAAPSQTLPPRGGMGKPGFPIPPARGLRPANPPTGRGVGKPGFPTPLLRGTMFTTDPHAAAPHTKGINIRFFLGGRSPPKPSRERRGNPSLLAPYLNLGLKRSLSGCAILRRVRRPRGRSGELDEHLISPRPCPVRGSVKARPAQGRPCGIRLYV